MAQVNGGRLGFSFRCNHLSLSCLSDFATRYTFGEAEMAEERHALKSALARFEQLDKELESATKEREKADRVVANLAQGDVVTRFKNARFICLRKGWAHS